MSTPVVRDGFLTTTSGYMYLHTDNTTKVKINSIFITNTVDAAYIVDVYQVRRGGVEFLLDKVELDAGDYMLYTGVDFELSSNIALKAKANAETVSYSINGTEEKII